MNKIIKQQLQKVTVANLGVYDDKTTVINIPQCKQDKFEVNHCYTIKLDSTLLNPMYNPVLVSNWNQGSYPRCDCLRVNVIKVVGRMINVNGVGFDFNSHQVLNYVWSGWLPTELVKQIEVL